MQRACVPTPLAFNASMVGPVIATFGSPGAEGAVPADDRQPRHLVVARASPSPTPAPTSPRCAPPRSATATSSSSTARRPGPRSASTATGSSAWSAPTPRPRSRRGISFLLIDMTTPGVTVRPIELIDGGHEVNEVWFEDVRVPAENLVGEENTGWDYAKFLLGNERVGVAPVGCDQAGARAGQGVRRLGRSTGGAPCSTTRSSPPDRRAGERAARPRADRAARGRALRRRQAAPRLVGAQAQGHRAPAGGQRAGRRPRRAGVAGLRRRRRLRPRRAGRAAPPRSTSTSARRRSTAGPTRSSGRSSPGTILGL